MIQKTQIIIAGICSEIRFYSIFTEVDLIEHLPAVINLKHYEIAEHYLRICVFSP